MSNCNQTCNCACSQTCNCTCNQSNTCPCNNIICSGGTLIGGWNIDIKCAFEIEPILCQCFSNALNAQVGVTYTILRYLGCQLVNGTNYGLLCSSTTVTNPPTTKLVVVVINRDLNGNCTVVSVTPILA